MTLGELLIGKRVRAIEDCPGRVIKGNIYKVEEDGYIGDGCQCLKKWELLDPISYKPKPHKHTLKCSECGAWIKVKKI